MQSGSSYFSGVAYNPGKIVVYGAGADNKAGRYFNSSGKVLGGSYYLNDVMKNSLISQLQQYCSISEIEMVPTPWPVSSYVPDWENILELEAI